MRHSPESIGKKMDALQLWSALIPYNWAVKPRGTVLPYFCSVTKGDGAFAKIRFLMLEGWQTLHDYVRQRADANFGYYSSPLEFPHLELVVRANGDPLLFRHDPGYVPVPASKPQRELAAKILWESYGLLMRLESEPDLPMKFAEDRAVFARVEGADGVWKDEPLIIPPPAPVVEKVSFRKADVKRAQDLPISKDDVIDVDFRLLKEVILNVKPRPRCIYQLLGIDTKTNTQIFDLRTSLTSDCTLHGMWEQMPGQLLKALIQRGRIPGEIRVRSGRVFRLLRPICLELPLKLSLHDSLESFTLLQ